MSSFECYSGATDPIQYLHQHWYKMAVHSHDNLLLSRVFSYSLRGTAYDWFYLLLRQSLRNFREVKQAFYHRYVF